MATERGGEEAPTRRTPQQQPSKGRGDGWKKFRKVRKAAVPSFFETSSANLKRARSRRRPGRLLQHLKTMNLEGKRDRSSGYIKDEDGVLLRDVELIRERWVRWFHTLLNAKSPKIDPNIAKGLDQWPENMPLGVQLPMQELASAIPSLANGKTVGPEGVSVEFFKITLNGDPALRRRPLEIIVCIRSGGEMSQQWKHAIIMVHKKKDRTECGHYRGIFLVAHAGKILLKIIARRLSECCQRVGILLEEQSGFRPNRFTTDIMFVIRRLQKLAQTKRILLYVCFIDLTKAYDSFDRILWKLLACFGVLHNMISIIRQFRDDMRACLQLDNIIGCIRGGFIRV